MFRGLRLTIARELHQFPSEVGRMPFSDVRDLADHFGEFPPVFLVAASMAGVKGKGSSEDMTPDDFQKLRAMSEDSDG